MKRHILKEERIDRILLSLKRLGYLTSSQIRVMHDLKSQRNTSRILNDMKDYISHFRDGENIYYLSTEGRLRTGAKVIRKKTNQAQHFIMRNQLYLYYGCPKDWKNEVELKYQSGSNEITIVSDATCTINGKKHNIEIDNIQKMSVNKEKLSKYRDLISKGAYGLSYPTIVWVTTTQTKKEKLEELCKEYGLFHQVFTYADIQINL